MWTEVTGGDALGRGLQPTLCWWLPEGSSVCYTPETARDHEGTRAKRSLGGLGGSGGYGEAGTGRTIGL